ncbi:MAG: exopolysaccharide biosynthesis polyprenyl glycosylphosphotransferase [Myxococcales bacterium]|nr:exopolysaccharide biosynthesis polyprenyl glycosylphosphotransferase [Myxococcales bacterium]
MGERVDEGRGRVSERPHRIGAEPTWTRFDPGDVTALFPICDLLMAAAWSDGELERVEREKVRELLAELCQAGGLVRAGADERPARPSGDAFVLPLALEVRVVDFDPEAFDLSETVKAFASLTPRERRRLVAMVREVCDANDAYDLEEDRFVQALVLALALTEEDVRDLVVTIAPYLTSRTKRAFDVLFAATVLALGWPLLLGIAGAVRATSKGPAIFKQRRYGRGGEEIEVWKFRTMRTQEDGAMVRQATKNDSRITPIGAFLRRTSLDELPQFVNVLRGEMSVVGPRPHAVAHNRHYRTQILEYMLRHHVKPGITGWAQVNGWRGETETLEKMVGRVEHDLAYVTKGSLWMDVRCVWLTVFGRKVRQNAY